MNEENLAELIFSHTSDVLTWYRLERVSKRFNRVGLRKRFFIRKQYTVYGNSVEHLNIYTSLPNSIKKHGPYIIWNAPGQKGAEFNYTNDHLHGRYRQWRSDGKIKKDCIYQNGKKHGHSMKWYQNGRKKSEKYYWYGLKDGPYTRWRASGSIWCKANYRRNILHGCHKSWNEFGLLVYENYHQHRCAV